MTSEEADRLIARIQKELWTKWQPPDDELASWGRILCRIELPSEAYEAFVIHKDRCDYNGPKKQAFLTAFQANQQTQAALDPLHDGCGGIWVMCVSTRAQGFTVEMGGAQVPSGWPTLLGQFRQIAYNRFVPLPDEDQRLRNAQRLRDELHQAYGGDWQVFQDFHRPVSYADMMEKSHTLQRERGQKP